MCSSRICSTWTGEPTAGVQIICQVGQQATQIVVSHHLVEANKKAKNDPEYTNSKEYKALQEKWGVGSDSCGRMGGWLDWG